MRRLCAVLLTGVLTAAIASRAHAQIGSASYAAIVVDSGTGNILFAANQDEPRFPASLTKMMTLYMVFEALRDRRVALNQSVPISWNASSMSPTKLGLVPGSLITVEQAILGLVTKSANDAAAALGEMLGGDEDRFAQMMTLRARSLGMVRTTFQNASGLPDWNQVTTARDMAILARRLIQDFPGYYHYFSTPSFVYGGRVVLNHQRLLQTYPGADGLKTGYIDASGYNVVTSARRGDTRLIGVVLGAATGAERDRHMAALLDQGFERLGVSPLLARLEPRVPSFISAAHAAASLPSPALSLAQPGPRRAARAGPQVRVQRPARAEPTVRTSGGRTSGPRTSPSVVRIGRAGPPVTAASPPRTLKGTVAPRRTGARRYPG